MSGREEAVESEIKTVRRLKASPQRVWKAWTDPAHLARWWGPKDFRNTFHRFDARPGGEWHFIMHSPGGTDFPNKSVFVELKPFERIVLDHLSRPKFRITATFIPKDGGTELTFLQTFESPEECAVIKVFAVPANEQNMDRLEAELARMT